MNEGGEKQCVAVNEVVALLRDKWTILVLGALRRAESLRYSELQRAVVGISQRMLTLTLKTLEENGLVKRTFFATIPPRVDYELTPMGRSLVTPLRGLLDWSMQHRDAMAEARRAYTRKTA
jgi:DNA-binding HxlR family transcriptional regulator